MRILKLILGFLVAASLAMLPLSAVATTHAGKTHIGTSVSGDDCPCCKSMQQDACPLKCCHVQALSVEGWAIAGPPDERFVERDARIAALIEPRPEPPPPRA